MRDYPLLDNNFLQQLNECKLKTIFAKVISLSFNGDAINEIIGNVASGSINIDGKSSMRRTCSLTLVTSNMDVSNIDWALRTKFRLFIGLKNDINPEYDDIIWFPVGEYVITSFSSVLNSTGFQISLTGKDKMCLLNGDVGGNVFAAHDFGTIYEYQSDGSIVKTKIRIYDIIKEAVHTYAQEPYSKIIINDLDSCAVELLDYIGEKIKMYVFEERLNDDSIWTSQIAYENQYMGKVCESAYQNHLAEHGTGNVADDFYFTYNNIQYHLLKRIDPTTDINTTVGRRAAKLVYNDDLILNIGEPITKMFDKLIEMLGDFEYFYDVQGNFVFQRKRIYFNSSWTNAVTSFDETYYENIATSSQDIYSFENNLLIESFNNKPQLSVIKNDYIIWGQKEKADGVKEAIHLRYAIDSRPTVYYSLTKKKLYIANTYIDNNNFTCNADAGIYDWRELIYQMAVDNLNKEKIDIDTYMLEVNSQVGTDDLIDSYMIDGNIITDHRLGWWANELTTVDDIKSSIFVFPVFIKDKRDNDPTDVTSLDLGLNSNYGFVCVNKDWTSIPEEALSYDLEQKQIVIDLNYVKDYYQFDSDILNPQLMSLEDWQTELTNENIKLSFFYMPTDFIVLGEDINKYVTFMQSVLYAVDQVITTQEDTIDCAFYHYLNQTNKHTYQDFYTCTLYDAYFDIINYNLDKYRLNDNLYSQYQRNSKDLCFNFLRSVNTYSSLVTWNNQQDQHYHWQYIINGLSEIKEAVNNYLPQFYDKWNEYQKALNVYVEEPRIILNKEVVATQTEIRENAFNTGYDAYYADMLMFWPSLYRSENFIDYVYNEDGSITLNAGGQPVLNKSTLTNDQWARWQTNGYWNPDLIDYNANTDTIQFITPESLTFWLDFLDQDNADSLYQYNTSIIGRRSKVINDDQIKAIYFRETPDILFVSEDWEPVEGQEKLAYVHINIAPPYSNYLRISSQGKSAKEVLDSELYKGTYAQETISFSCIPIYYLEPNTRISVNSPESGIFGEYIINSLSYSISHNAMMTINASRAAQRII